MKLSRIPLFTSLLFASLGGCTNSTEPEPATITIPGTGSSYTTSTIVDPLNGSQPIISHDRVVQSNISAYGMTNCIAVSPDENPLDTEYYSYASNGDVWLYLEQNDRWFNLPFGSQTTTINVAPGTNGITGGDTVRGSGSGFVTIHGRAYPTENVEINETFNNYGLRNFGG